MSDEDRTYRTKSGRVLTEADIQALADEAERGYDVGPAKSQNATQNTRGEWVPSIPMPFWGLRLTCRCGRKFWTLEGYRGHYAYAHALGMISQPLPPTKRRPGFRGPG